MICPADSAKALWESVALLRQVHEVGPHLPGRVHLQADHHMPGRSYQPRIGPAYTAVLFIGP
jgi:hypothetical protein